MVVHLYVACYLLFKYLSIKCVCDLFMCVSVIVLCVMFCLVLRGDLQREDAGGVAEGVRDADLHEVL